MENTFKIVEFDKWCKTCKYKDYPEEAKPCCDCLEEPAVANSSKPMYYKKQEKPKKKENKKE